MSIAVEQGKFLLTANNLRKDILHIFMCRRKLRDYCLSGGNS